MREPTLGVVPRCHFVNIATLLWRMERIALVRDLEEGRLRELV